MSDQEAARHISGLQSISSEQIASFEDDMHERSQYQSLTGLLAILRRRWATIAVTFVLTAGVGLLACVLIRAYVATTIIEINKDDPSDNGVEQVNGATLTSDEVKNEVQTDVNILQTDDELTLRVISKLKLLDQMPFAKAIDPSEQGRPLDQAPKTRDRVLTLFRSHLKVENPPDTRLITIAFRCKDPVLASSIANTMANTFIEDTLARRQRSIISSSAWLQPELQSLKAQVQQSEQNLADYERDSGLAGIELVGSSSGSGATTVSVSPENTVKQRLLGLNQELTAAESNRISAETVFRLMQSHDPDVVLGLGAMNVASGSGAGTSSISPDGIALVSALRAQESELTQQYAASSAKYGENNPRLIELGRQKGAVEQQLQAELERLRLRAANDFAYAKRNEDTIRQEFKKQEAAADVMADKSVKLQLLAQEAFSNRALYESLYSKLQASTLSSGTRATRIDVVAAAIPSGSPAIPKWGIYLLAICAAALFLGGTAAFIRESADDTVRASLSLGEIFGAMLLGYVPRMRTGPRRGESALITNPHSPFSESFRSLRTAIDLSNQSGPPRVLLVTSALGGEGKTTVAYNLGLALAQQGGRVLLIDADLRNPELHHYFGMPGKPGVTGACKGMSEGEEPDILVHPQLSNLFLLPAGERPEFPSELLGSKEFDSLVKALSAEYDRVIIDSPPLLSVADASIIAKKVDGIIAVVRACHTSRAELLALMHSIRRLGASFFRILLNDVSHPTLNGLYEYSYTRRKERKFLSSPPLPSKKTINALLLVLSVTALFAPTSASQSATAPKVGGNGTFDSPPIVADTNSATARRRLMPVSAVPANLADLKLAPGFLLDMEVFDCPEFSFELRIDSAGNVNVPTIGVVHVADMNLADAASRVASAFREKKILVDPQVNLNIEEYAGSEVTILGEVHAPGRTELLGPRRLDEVLAMAGGMTEYAGNNIEIRHSGDSGAESNVVRFSHKTEREVLSSSLILPGDIVTVKRAGIVYVLGGVTRPGGYVMQESGELDVTQALSLAYGTVMNASVNSIRVIRKTDDGRVQEIPVPYGDIVKGKAAPMHLQSEDVVYVPISKVKTVLGSGLLNTGVAAAVIYTHY